MEDFIEAPDEQPVNPELLDAEIENEKYALSMILLKQLEEEKEQEAPQPTNKENKKASKKTKKESKQEEKLDEFSEILNVITPLSQAPPQLEPEPKILKNSKGKLCKVESVWAHVTCALVVPEAKFADHIKKGPIAIINPKHRRANVSI